MACAGVVLVDQGFVSEQVAPARIVESLDFCSPSPDGGDNFIDPFLVPERVADRKISAASSTPCRTPSTEWKRATTVICSIVPAPTGADQKLSRSNDDRTHRNPSLGVRSPISDRERAPNAANDCVRPCAAPPSMAACRTTLAGRPGLRRCANWPWACRRHRRQWNQGQSGLPGGREVVHLLP